MADYLKQPVTHLSAPPSSMAVSVGENATLACMINDILQFQERKRALFKRTLELLKEVHSAS